MFNVWLTYLTFKCKSTESDAHAAFLVMYSYQNLRMCIFDNQ